MNRTLAALLGLAAFGLYLRTLAPGLLGGDSGELQFAAYLGGIAHPTGYPLYLMLGWLWTHIIPWGDVAWRMNLFSALWGGVAVALTYLLARRLLREATPRLPTLPRLLAAAVAALAFACSETFWSQAVIAEIYTLHAAFVAGGLWLLLWWKEGDRGNEGKEGAEGALGRLAVVALIYGLGLTHHRTMLLLAPAVLLFLWLTRRRLASRPSSLASRPSSLASCLLPPASCLLLLASCLLPLLLYLYIPLRAPHTPYLTVPLSAGHSLQLYDHRLRGFLDFVLGRVFVGELLPPAAAAARLALAGELLWRQFGWAGIVLGLVGLARLVAGRRGQLLALTGLSFLALLLFNLFYGIGDIHVFFIAPALIWACWMGVGIGAIAEAVGAGGRSQVAGRHLKYTIPSVLSAAIVLLSLTLPIALLLHNLSLVDRSGDSAGRDRWQAILAAPPPAEAILISNDRDEMMPLWYLQQVEGVRPDITGLFPRIVGEPGWANVGQVVERALSTGRPVYLIKPMPGLEVKFALRPVRNLVEVVGPAASGPPGRSSGLAVGGAIQLLGYDLRSPLEGGSVLEVALHWQPLRPLDGDYTSFVHLLDAQGEKVAQSDHLPGGVYYPTSLWQPGETLLDVHRLELPAALGPAPYTLLVGFYRQPSMERLGEPLRLAGP
ncbi:MAG: DUF2723 domain-containing protein [Anaerolineae bacterium]|nr:DUF2723 domain-containing protein [Anaerolineae bacterium]